VRVSTIARSLRFATLALLLGLVAAACRQGDAIRQEALDRSTAVTFETADGVTLAGRIFGPEDATAGVVLAHMLPADQTSWYDFAQRLGSMGYRALTFDFRGYCPGGDAGCSRGDRSIAAIWQDVLVARSYLVSQGVTRVALVGASMGGTASLVAAAQIPGDVEAVITLSAPVSIEGLTAGPDVVQASGAANLFMAGDGDSAAAEAASTFYGESLQPKKLSILTTSDHGTDLLTGNQGEIARTTILTWLGQYLPVTEPVAQT
jgi:pimeloyl-ACP methyl ester carboxylesterase